MEKKTTRLNKFISETGYCSRREADRLIQEGKVKINGIVPELGTQVGEDDVVSIDDKIISLQNEFIYLAFHKPPGIICTTETNVKDNIIDYLNYPKRIFPIGRLDRASEGLIFLTNDGDIVNKILRAGNNHEKEYMVTVDRPITAKFITEMSNGIPILDTVTRKCKVEKTDKHEFKIILTQGLNRQIRRMCDYLDFRVQRLIRTRIMNVTLENLEPGSLRELSIDEMQIINALISGSSKTEEASNFD
ncbi:MAG TPA: 23S rRNA pseudouridine(2604) synthase RluF [Bacteroidia bacterium]|nr:23S rRNA pseudouridine(2604) synthase RluF [Bacteroidia bacterium]HNS11674.1 23S rRNA pseudouridine(2604) synthase RluF [Bacteroidia bacterium]